MPTFRIFGTDRAIGAIGLMERYWRILEAPDEQTARRIYAEGRYAAGREHVHILLLQIVPANEEPTQ